MMSKIRSIWHRLAARMPRFDIETNTIQINKSQSLEAPVSKSIVSANQSGTTAAKPDFTPRPKIDNQHRGQLTPRSGGYSQSNQGATLEHLK
jgi:hypothetical protein